MQDTSISAAVIAAAATSGGSGSSATMSALTISAITAIAEKTKTNNNNNNNNDNTSSANNNNSNTNSGEAPTSGTSDKLLPKAYGKIVLTLENVLLPEEKISPTPSSLDGLDEESEIDLRIMGCELITTAGILLKLPQTAMATGQVLFQRFYYSKSFIRQPMEPTAMACVYLASKIEEAPRRIRDVVNVFHHIKLVRAGKTIQPMILDAAYIRTKNDVTLAERRVLKELGFCVHVKHPHKLIVVYLQQLSYNTNSEFVQLSWNYMSDALRSNVFVRYTPEAIACACIFLSARMLKIPLPNNPPWYISFDATEEQIVDICENILALYERPKVNYEQLEKKLEQLIKAYQDSKQKLKSAASASSSSATDKANVDTPTSNSPRSRPSSPQQTNPSANAMNNSNSSSAVTNGKDKERVDDNSKDRERDRDRDRERDRDSRDGRDRKKDESINKDRDRRRCSPVSPEPVKRSRRTPSPIIYDDSPKRHKSKKRKKTSSRYARSYSSSRSRSRSRERKSSKKRSRRSGRSRSRSYTPPPPKRHHHHKHKSHRR